MKNRILRARYFRKQKLMGVLLTLLGILTAFLLEGDITVAMIIVPLGLYVIFTKKMVLSDDYYWAHQAIHSSEKEEA